MRFGSWAVVIAALLPVCACTALDVSKLQPNISSSLKSELACTPSAAQAQAEAQAMNASAMTNAVQTALGKLPPQLQADKVVRTLFAQPLYSTATGTSRANGQTPDTSAVPEADSKLTYGDIEQFAKTVRSTYLQPTATSLTNATQPAPAATGNDAFGIYFRNYYEGTFYDRYGVNLTKPTFSATIGDTEIDGALTMLIEYFLDSVDKSTPIFGDAAPPSPAPDGDTIPEQAGTVTFYPSAVKFQPTAYAAGLAKYAYVPATAPADSPCSITVDKVRFLGEFATSAGSSGNLLSGITVGSFGGFGFSFFGFFKFSLGDNKTLSGIVETLATRLAMRAAYDAAYPIVLHVRTVPKITITNGVISVSSN